jgi:drug/metabolite transporter (DMT)-like permease
MTPRVPGVGDGSSSMRTRVALAIIVLYFGASLPGYKLAGESFGPATTNLIRFVIASALLSIIARGRLPTDRSVRRRLFLIGVGGLGLMALLMGIGVDEGSAVIGSVVVGLEPIGVAIGGMLLARDRVSPRTLLALAVGFLGALVASGLFTERTGPSPVVPVVLLLGTVAAFSVYTAMVRSAAGGVDPLATAAITQVGALTFVIPACLFDLLQRGDVTEAVPSVLAPLRGMVRGDVEPKALAAAVLIGVGSGVSYLLLCLVLAREPANRLAITLYLTPVVGVLCSWLLVGESLHWRDAAGAALVLVAIGISEYRRAPAPALEGASA